MTVRLFLTAYTPYVDLPREFIREQMAGSILAQALQEDPEAKEINIPTRDVTPTALGTLNILSQNKIPLQSTVEGARADRYLNYPLLSALDTVIYGRLNKSVINHPDNHRVLEREMKPENEAILPFLIWVRYDFTTTSAFLLPYYAAASNSSYLPALLAQPTLKADTALYESALDRAIKSERAPVENMRLLLERIDGKMPQPKPFLENCIERGNKAKFDFLLTHPLIKETLDLP